MDNPLITYFLIAFNQEKFIREAVESALAQTYSPLEIILSDDASHDQTFEIMRELAASYQGPHQIVLNRNTKNLGLCGHVNKVFELSKGEWVVAAAGDDISYPNRVATLYCAAMQMPDTTAVTSAYDKIDEAGNSLSIALPERLAKGRVDSHGDPVWVARFTRGGEIGVHGATCMWRKRLFTEFGPIPSDVPAEDTVLSFRAYLTGSVIYTPEHLMKHRTHKMNIHGHNETDIKIIESRAQAFSRRHLAVAICQVADFRLYLSNHPEGPNAIIAQQLVDHSFYQYYTRSQWWDQSFLWRVAKSIDALCSGNWIEFRWTLKRLFGLRALKVLSKIRLNLKLL